MPSNMIQDVQEQREALASVHPSVLLAAIRAGAKPRVEDHLVPMEAEGHGEHEASMQSSHREEAKLVKAAARQLVSIRAKTHARVDDHLAAKETELCRSKLTASMQLKHGEEAAAAKAARRRLEAIRHGASAKVEDHQPAEVEAALESFAQRTSDKLRKARRQQKAHVRQLKAVRASAEAKISTALDADVENARGLVAQRREQRMREQIHEARRVQKVLHAIKSGHCAALASDEIEDPAAELLRAARRGSLARSLHAPAQLRGSPSRYPRDTDRLSEALNNRLARRRHAVCDAMIALGKAQDNRLARRRHAVCDAMIALGKAQGLLDVMRR